MDIRENIKFRAWDKRKKAMFDVVAINWELERVYSTWNDKNGKNLYAPMDDVILMNYIHKNDERGNRIYEGDIINVKRENFDGDGQKYDVFKYVIKWDYYYSGYEPFQDDYSYPDEGFVKIGNIFEDDEYKVWQEEYFDSWSEEYNKKRHNM